eukprot:PITA_22755
MQSDRIGQKNEKEETMATTVMVCMACISMLLPFSAADPEIATVWYDCGNNGDYRNGSAFQLHLNTVLESLVENVYQSGFYTTSVVQNSNSTVYGLVQCRGYLDSSDCKQCASTAKSNLVEACSYNTSGFIQLDGCFLRYDNYNFYNENDSTKDTLVNVFCNTGNSSQPQRFTNDVRVILSNITAQAAQSPKLFAPDSAPAPSSQQYIYSIAQCWRVLSRTGCGSCLSFAISNILRCQIGALGAQFGSENCYLRYEVYAFFNTFVLLSPAPAESPQPSSEGKGSKVLGIVLGVVGATLALSAAICLWKWKFLKRKRNLRTRGPETDNEGEVMILTPTITNPKLIFDYDVLKEATSNFKMENKLGEGGFGSVFKGILPDGREVAVKRLYIGSRQGDAEFLNEANLISRVQHRNLVKVMGCSVESSERLLVYDYLPNRSLDKILFDATKRHLLDWKKRYEIIVGTARGLAYLHDESEIRIIHRDIKASNILLDDKYRPKIADFGLDRLFAEDQSHVSTRVAGTLGYMAPEYALRGQLTEKADVFSFGVLVLEIISGRKNQDLSQDMEFLIEGTWKLYEADRVIEAMDSTLKKGSYLCEDGIRVITIGLLCTQAAAALRPSMSGVVRMMRVDAAERSCL